MKVLLIDDHPLILVALQQVIQGLGDHLSVIGASGARAAREILQRDADFDLVLLDLQLGDADGFDVLTEFRNTYPAIPVVVLSASDRTSDVIRSIDLGAMGFVPKRASNETLFEALHLVMSGGIYVPPMSMGSPSASASEPSETATARASTVHNAAWGSDFQRAPVALEALGLTPRLPETLSAAAEFR